MSDYNVWDDTQDDDDDYIEDLNNSNSDGVVSDDD